MDRVPVEALGPFLEQIEAGRLSRVSRAWRGSRIASFLRRVIVSSRTPLGVLRNVTEVEVRRKGNLGPILRELGPRLSTLRLHYLSTRVLSWLRKGGAPNLVDLACWTGASDVPTVLEAASRGCPGVRKVFVAGETPEHFLVRRADETAIASHLANLPHLQDLAIVGDVFHDRVDLYAGVPRVVVVASSRCLLGLRRERQKPRPARLIVQVRRATADLGEAWYIRRYLKGVTVRTID